MTSKYNKIDLSNIRTYSGTNRKSLVTKDILCKDNLNSNMKVSDFLQSLPNLLKSKDLLELSNYIIQARQNNKPVIFMIGGHVIKSGCSPILINLIKENIITHIASNGSAIIHDIELDIFGHTSEDVSQQLNEGQFGMVDETSQIINYCSSISYENNLGFGEAIGKYLVENHYTDSLISNCYQYNVPYTSHVAIGTDINHQHHSCNGCYIGYGTYTDFKIFTNSISEVGNGGVIINFGSSVIMPEVFLKSISICKNLGYEVENFVVGNFDMIQHYRPNVNILQRSGSKKSFSITGHHEIMIPLLYCAIQSV